MPDTETDTSVVARTPAPEAPKRKGPATLMKEKIERLEAENAALKAKTEAEATEAKADAPVSPRSRSNTEGKRRRSRGKNDLSHQMKLGVGFDLDPNFEYRWINGGLDDQRLHDKCRPDQQGGDWAPVTSTGEEVSDSTGSVLRRAVGMNQGNQVEYSYCCRKPKDLYEEDAGVLQALNDKRMQAIQKGEASEPGQKRDDDGLGYGQKTELTGQGRKAITL